jgi:hypothetical protein
VPRIRLSSRITDTDPGRPVAQALRELTNLANEHDQTIPALVARLDQLARTQLTPDQIQTALSPTGTAPLTGGGTTTGVTAGLIFVGLHADRLGLAPTAPTLFWELDRTLLYAFRPNVGWRYVAGILQTTFTGDPTCPDNLKKPPMTALDDVTMTAAYTASFEGLYGRPPTGVPGSGIDDTAYWIGVSNHYGKFSDGWCRAGWSRYWELKLSGADSVDPAFGDVAAFYYP